MLVDVQSKLTVDVRDAMADVLDSRLLPTIQQHLHSLHTTLVDNDHNEEHHDQAILSKLEEKSAELHIGIACQTRELNEQNETTLAAIRHRDESIAKSIETLKTHMQTAIGSLKSDDFAKKMKTVKSTKTISVGRSSLAPSLQTLQQAGSLLNNPTLQKSYQEFKDLSGIP